MNEIRFNPPPRSERQPAEEETQREKAPSASKIKKILKAVAAVALLAVLVWLVFVGKDFVSSVFKEKKENYSAVFLSNGQVYFGKMIENNRSEIVLNNVYYIQLNDKGGQEASTTLNQPSFNLVKLGNELHGPTDELFINRDQVVFYENLRDDSKVVESIKNYKP